MYSMSSMESDALWPMESIHTPYTHMYISKTLLIQNWSSFDAVVDFALPARISTRCWNIAVRICIAFSHDIIGEVWLIS